MLSGLGVSDTWRDCIADTMSNLTDCMWAFFTHWWTRFICKNMFFYDLIVGRVIVCGDLSKKVLWKHCWSPNTQDDGRASLSLLFHNFWHVRYILLEQRNNPTWTQFDCWTYNSDFQGAFFSRHQPAEEISWTFSRNSSAFCGLWYPSPLLNCLCQ